MEDFCKQHTQEVLNTLDTMRQVFIAKNKDYGNSFAKSYQKRGLLTAITRMEDKWNRIDNLTSGNGTIEVKDEALEDTLLDLANYAAMTYALIRCQQKATSEQETVGKLQPLYHRPCVLEGDA